MKVGRASVMPVLTQSPQHDNQITFAEVLADGFAIASRNCCAAKKRRYGIENAHGGQGAR